MLNMLFDFGNTNGRFVDYPTPPNLPNNNPLLNSKTWLRISANNNPPTPLGGYPGTFDPHNQGNWVNLGRFNVHIPKSAGNGHQILIRIAPAPVPAQNTNWLIDYAVAFGRPSVGGGQNASPFETNTGDVKTTYIEKNVVPTSPGGIIVGWIINLGQIANSGSPTGVPPGGAAFGGDLTNRYEFALGIVVKDNASNTERHFGEDPEEDVGG
jgi:hypothetical protein